MDDYIVFLRIKEYLNKWKDSLYLWIRRFHIFEDGNIHNFGGLQILHRHYQNSKNDFGEMEKMTKFMWNCLGPEESRQHWKGIYRTERQDVDREFPGTGDRKKCAECLMGDGCYPGVMETLWNQ